MLSELQLGPGASGFGDDSLFSYQLVEAGFRLKEVLEAIITHYLDGSRLQRAQWLADARKRGRSSAYLAYHWFHQEIKNPRLRFLYFALKLYLRHVVQPPGSLTDEGYAGWEISYVFHLEACNIT